LRSEIPQEPQLPMLENGSGAVGWSSSLSPISSDSGFVSVSKLWAEATERNTSLSLLSGAYRSRGMVGHNCNTSSWEAKARGS
jgi:hypothetical protein